VGAHTVIGFLALRGLASLRWLRKRGGRFAQEQAMIERWLDGVRLGLRSDWNVGHEIAQCGRLIKGYGTTNERGKENLLHVLDHLATATFDSEHARAEAITAARASALEDDTGKALDRTLASHGAPPRPIKVQPVVWMKKPRQPVS
jgi:indolepyruvate ferredoxin oxidoreductase beta subunit